MRENNQPATIERPAEEHQYLEISWTDAEDKLCLSVEQLNFWGVLEIERLRDYCDSILKYIKTCKCSKKKRKKEFI